MDKFQGAIFDMDGTLIDSMKVWAQVDKDYMNAHGLPLEADYVEAINAMGLMEAAAYTKERYQIPDLPEAIVEEWKALCLFEYRHHVELKPGAKEYLDFLRSEGVKIALATSSPRLLADAALRRCDVYGHFDVLITADEVAEGKQSPKIYHTAAKALGISPENCCVFEDIPQGIESAKRAGMQTVGVFDEAAAPKDWERVTVLADRAILSFHELLK